MPNTITFAKIVTPLTHEEKQETERLIRDAYRQAGEAKQVSERLKVATKLYRERLTGQVEDR
jgi:hypothetical protein